jgi:hypothetical protein
MKKSEVTQDTIQEIYGKAKEQYDALVTHRSSLEHTWRQCALLTLPHIFPK